MYHLGQRNYSTKRDGPPTHTITKCDSMSMHGDLDRNLNVIRAWIRLGERVYVGAHAELRGSKRVVYPYVVDAVMRRPLTDPTGPRNPALVLRLADLTGLSQLANGCAPTRDGVDVLAVSAEIRELWEARYGRPPWLAATNPADVDVDDHE